MHSNTQTLIVLFAGIVTSGYGIGTFFGKLGAWLFQHDPAHWGDLGGIIGGLFGLGVFIGVAIAMVTT